jgi:ParB family chromosome partitioning protein
MNAPISTSNLRAGLADIPLAQIDDNGPFQQRLTPVEVDKAAGFEQSIRTMGVLQPILVRWNELARLYQVIDGHRRTAAARALGIESIPAKIVSLEAREATAAGVATNIARAPLAPVDQWRALAHLVELGWTPNGAALALGIGERLARKLTKLGQLHPDVLAAIEAHGMPPNDDSLGTIANAPQDMQAAAIKAKDAWQPDWREKGRKTPSWHHIAHACRIARIPAKRAIFDTAKAADLAWEEDLFAQPGSDDALTTRDVQGFMAHQQAALLAREKRSKKLHATGWDAKTSTVVLPKGWKFTFEKDTPGAERYAAVVDAGPFIGEVREAYAVPPAPPAGKKAKDAARKESPTESGGAQGAEGDARDDAGGTGGITDSHPDSQEYFSPADASPAKVRPPLTERGTILVAQAKTTAIRCALRDHADTIPFEHLLAVLVLAIAGDNVTVHGDPASRYRPTAFHDLVARLVTESGALRTDLTVHQATEIAAEAAARIIVCGPRAKFDSGSGDAAEWIGRALGAKAVMPRLDTPEILATVTGDALKQAAIAVGDAGKGTTKALRERLAGHAEGLVLPGSAFSAKGPPRAERKPKGHAGPFPCASCTDPEYCIAEVVCESGAGGEDEATEALGGRFGNDDQDGGENDE